MNFSYENVSPVSDGSGYEESIRKLESIISTESQNSFLSKITEALSFDNYSICICSPVSLVYPNLIVDTNHSQEWDIKYKKEKFYLVDPTLHYSISKALPVRWDDLENMHEYQEKHYKDYLTLAKCSGQVSGITFPFISDSKDYIHLNLSSNGSYKEMEEAIKKALVLVPWLSASIFEKARQLKVNHAKTERDIKLTKREKECLFWACEGKTAWEISKIVKISESTTNFHLKNSVQKLNAKSRQHAVAKALMFGIVKPDLTTQ
ncbi:MAG: hypothetical protein COA78_04030 [Blastopirellula sp.]|nr:MAG: hypothetical protein COA78_04030 [Blastopirellula sp.]